MVYDSEDYAEGIKAFKEKRKPSSQDSDGATHNTRGRVKMLSFDLRIIRELRAMIV